MERRVLSAVAVIGLGLVLVMGRLIQLTIVEHEKFAQRAARQHDKRITWTPHRGTIVDRNGTPLALSVAAESLFVRPSRLSKDSQTLKKQIPALATALQMPAPKVARLLTKDAPFVWLRRRASPQIAAQVRSLGMPGIGSRETERRFYPQGSLAASLIGFTNVDAQGLEGVEYTYDRYLRGEQAELLGQRDAFGRMILTHGVEGQNRKSGQDKKAGEDTQTDAFQVRLTLDAGLQYVAQQALDRAVQKHAAKAGTVVVLDPRTFAVLAMVQVPTFDPNTPGTIPSTLRRNRIVSDVHEPGSTLKALFAAAALDSHVVKADEQIYCERGRYQIGRRTIHDHHPYEWLSFAEVIKHSSNIGVAKVAERLGQEAYYRYLRAFGLGQTTGIDLPAESSGLLPQAKKWARITMATTSFGHGIAVTPLQLASVFATLANDGVLMRPYVVQEIRNTAGEVVKANSPQHVWQAVQADTAKQTVQLLEGVVEEDGTGPRARIDGFRVAGKTGTAQKIDAHGKYSNTDYIASFVGIVPADAPRFVIAVSVDQPTENGHYGGQVAAPVFQEIATHALASQGIETATPLQQKNVPSKSFERAVSPAALPVELRQTRNQTDQTDNANNAQQHHDHVENGSPEPNFLGLSLREALRVAREQGWQVTLTGSGYVAQQTVRHDPDSGQPFYALALAPTGHLPPARQARPATSGSQLESQHKLGETL
jgi:cell division protein FtsI (penicillin-binding protein 3)